MQLDIAGWGAIALASWSMLACKSEPPPPPHEQLPDPSASVARFAATAPQPNASAPLRHRLREPMHGPAGVLLNKLRIVQLSPKQESAVSAIEADLQGSSDPFRLHGELARAVAESVRAGKIDRKKLEPQLKVARDLASQDKARQAKALNALHATLDEAQRKAVVGALRTQLELKSGHPSFSAKGDESPTGLSSRRAQRELDRLSRDLELSTEQQKKVEQLLAANPNFAPNRRDGREAPAALLDAFEKPTFDASELKLELDGEEAFQQRLNYLDRLTQLLTVSQRNTLASSLIDRGGIDHYRKPSAEREPRPDDSPKRGTTD